MAERYPAMVGLKLPADTYKALTELAREDDRSISAYLRRLVIATVEQRKNQSASVAPTPEARQS